MEKGLGATPNLYRHFTSAETAGYTMEEKLDTTVNRLSLIIERQPVGRDLYDPVQSIDRKIRSMDIQLKYLLEDGVWYDDVKDEDIFVNGPEQFEKYARLAMKPLLDTAAIIQDVGGFLPDRGENSLIEDPDHQRKLGGARLVDIPSLKEKIFEGVQKGIEKINSSDTIISLKYPMRSFDDMFQDIDAYSVREVDGQDMELPKIVKGLEKSKRF